MSPYALSCVGTILVSLCIVAVPSNGDTYFTTEADPFLGRVAPTRSSIHAEIEDAVFNSRRGDVQGRLARLEAQLLPTFRALPKNEHGRLESTVVRYLLHRHFLRQHAWLVSGLAPDGAAWNSTSPDLILEGHVPKRVHELIRGHLHRGLNLRETSVLAALLENQVHDDAVDRLHTAWKQLGMPRDALRMQRLQDVLDVYMLSYIPGVARDGRRFEDMLKDALDIYPTFNRTRSFVHELVQGKVGHTNRTLGLTDAEEIVVEISERYGEWQNGECKDLKRDLLAMGGPRTGYTDLRAFYRKAVVDQQWQFTESVPYLRALGALDESKPDIPNLLIANYMNSPSQYIASSHFYSVTCLDECEPILAQIEAQLDKPYATVEEVMDITEIQDQLAARQRLVQIADVHHGEIPLHGRLFQQWLHYVYPAECAYPHVAGTTRLETPEVFEARTDVSTVETEESMKARVKGWNEQNDAVGEYDGLWNPHEELLAWQKKAVENPVILLLSSLTPYHVGGIASVAGVSLALLAKVMLCGAVQGTASVALLRVDA